MPSFEKILREDCKAMNLVWKITGLIEKQNDDYNVLHIICMFLLNLRAHVFGMYSCVVDVPNHMDQLIFDIPPMLICKISTHKYINFLWYRKEYLELKRTIEKKVWKDNANSSDEEKRIILENSHFMFRGSQVSVIGLQIGSAAWLLKPIIEMYLLSRNGDPFQLLLPFKCWWPFNLDCRSNMYFYVFDYSVQVLSALSATAGFSAFTCWYIFVVLHTKSQFQLIQIRMKNFNKTKSGSFASVKEQEKILNQCIVSHQEHLEFCRKVELVFAKPFLTECIIMTIFLCCSGFGLKMLQFHANTWMAICCIICLLAGTFEVFCICFIANLITTESFKVAEAAYDSDWYNAPVKIQKKILFIIARAQKPVYISAGGFTALSLEVFETIIRTAASYFTVLNSVGQ